MHINGSMYLAQHRLTGNWFRYLVTNPLPIPPWSGPTSYYWVPVGRNKFAVCFPQPTHWCGLGRCDSQNGNDGQSVSIWSNRSRPCIV